MSIKKKIISNSTKLLLFDYVTACPSPLPPSGSAAPFQAPDALQLPQLGNILPQLGNIGDMLGGLFGNSGCSLCQSFFSMAKQWIAPIKSKVSSIHTARIRTTPHQDNSLYRVAQNNGTADTVDFQGFALINN